MASVYICYARFSWTRDNIVRMFNTAFDADIVERVDEIVMSDITGFDFKIFFVVFSHSNELFQEMDTENKKAMEGNVHDPETGERFEKYFKFTPVQKYWDIRPAKIRIRIEEETARVARIKEVNRVMFFEAEYIEEESYNLTLLVPSIRLV
jgi:hypothetical protein